MTAEKRKLGDTLRWAAMVLLLISVPNPGWGQASVPAPLPPAAQEALNKGIIAAKVPDYPLAIRFFEETRKLAPAAPVVFLNLGIAESKMAGRELRAMAWFGAYLAAMPDAPNAAAVKEQIAMLDIKSQSNLSRLIKAIERPPIQTISPNELRYTVEMINLKNLSNVSMLWAKAGDIKASYRIAELIKGEPFVVKTYKGRAYQAIAEAQEEAGDIVGAKKTAALIQNVMQQGPDEARAQRVIAAAEEKRRSATVATRDWLERLDDQNNRIDHHDCALNSGPFLDLDEYLKALPPFKNSQSAFESSFSTAWNIATAQSIIHRMLKRQAGQ